MDWRPGDLALCIKQGGWVYSGSGRPNTSTTMRAGMFATVRRVGMSSRGHLTLWFEGWPGERFMDGFGAIRFRKIRPHTPDHEDFETIHLLSDNLVGA